MNDKYVKGQYGEKIISENERIDGERRIIGVKQCK